MNKNKKILLTIITMLVSTILFTSRANAIVMWMQCTATADGEMYHNDAIDEGTDWIWYGNGNHDYKKYNTIALINDIDGYKSTRNVFYVGNDFFGVNGPQFMMYTSKTGQLGSQACWYNNEYKKNDPGAHGPLGECDKESDYVSASELAEGKCPNAMYQTLGDDTNGGVKGDFVILQGLTTPSKQNVEVLETSKIVIYKYGDGTTEYTMIEMYDSNGVYGNVYTSPDGYKELAKHTGLKKGSDKDDLLNSDLKSYSDKYVNWTMYTQLIRLYKLGRNYYKITEDSTYPEVLLINAGSGGDYTVVSGSQLYSDKNKVWPTVQTWYDENSKNYAEQIKIAEKFESSGAYKKLMETAKEINEAVDKGRAYNFDSSYNSKSMLADLEKAYGDLNTLLNSKEAGYVSYNTSCDKESKLTSDAEASIYTYFNCQTFGKSDLSEYSGKNQKRVEEVLRTTLAKQLSMASGSNMSIEKMRTSAEDNTKILAKAAAYLKSNGLLDGNEELINNYTELVRTFGTELVYDCETLLGEDLRNEIKSYLNIIKIAVPIILMGFGIIDFSKALFSSDEGKMKDSQKKFIKRVVVAILIFFVPTIVELLLSIANKVWTFISPNNCGLF